MRREMADNGQDKVDNVVKLRAEAKARKRYGGAKD